MPLGYKARGYEYEAGTSHRCMTLGRGAGMVGEEAVMVNCLVVVVVVVVLY